MPSCYLSTNFSEGFRIFIRKKTPKIPLFAPFNPLKVASISLNCNLLSYFLFLPLLSYFSFLSLPFSVLFQSKSYLPNSSITLKFPIKLKQSKISPQNSSNSILYKIFHKRAIKPKRKSINC